MLAIKTKGHSRIICPKCSYPGHNDQFECSKCGTGFEVLKRYHQKRQAIKDANAWIRLIEGVHKGKVLDHV